MQGCLAHVMHMAVISWERAKDPEDAVGVKGKSCDKLCQLGFGGQLVPVWTLGQLFGH